MKPKNVLTEIVKLGRCRENCHTCLLRARCINEGPGKGYKETVSLIVERAREELEKLERLEYLESMKS
jgi:biotin synthase-like enzyme